MTDPDLLRLRIGQTLLPLSDERRRLPGSNYSIHYGWSRPIDCTSNFYVEDCLRRDLCRSPHALS